MIPDEQQIKEIAGQLDCGFRTFCHRMTYALLFIPDERKFPAADSEGFEEDQEQLEANPDDYFEIEAMDSANAYRVMEAFAEQLTNVPLREKLLRALDRRGPFREFRFVIDNSGDYREQWFAFKNQQYVDWVRQQIIANQ